MTAERRELHLLVDDLDEEDVRVVLQLVKSHALESGRGAKSGPKSAGRASDWLAEALDESRPKLTVAELTAGVKPLMSLDDLHQSTTRLTAEESAALEEFLNS